MIALLSFTAGMAYGFGHSAPPSPVVSPSPISSTSPGGLVPSPLPSASPGECSRICLRDFSGKVDCTDPVCNPSPSPSPSIAPAGPLRISFDPVEYYSTPTERLKIKRVGELVNRVVQSKCFADFMRGEKLTWTGGRTPDQVVRHLQSLSAHVPVQMYYRCMRSWHCPTGTTAVAYRNPGDPTIHINQAVFFPEQSDCEWAGTFAHEGDGHAIGEYDHSFEWTLEREYTVPYKMGGSKPQYGGDAFEKCCHALEVQ